MKTTYDPEPIVRDDGTIWFVPNVMYKVTCIDEPGDPPPLFEGMQSVRAHGYMHLISADEPTVVKLKQ